MLYSSNHNNNNSNRAKVLLLLLVGIVVCWGQEVDVNVTQGAVHGFVNLQGTHKVWYLPYAAPPIGDLRWQSPQPLYPWNGTYDASVLPPVCPQASPSVTGLRMSEDCLYLAIFVPLNHSTSDSQLPVQIFVHGGSFMNGGSQLYDGSILSGTDLIFVAASYRLGFLGTMAHPALRNSPGRSDGLGFYAIQDQRAAFQWVRDNIGFFGGDKTKVTISGESAGAISVCTHLASPRSKGLFSQAISESGFCTIWTNDTAYQAGYAAAQAVGCNSTIESEVLSCLLNTNASALVQAASPYGNLLPGLSSTGEIIQQPIAIILTGGGNRVPLLIGTNKNESTLFICSSASNLTAEQYEQKINSTYPPLVAAQILQMYPVSAYPTPVAAYTDGLSDLVFSCPSKFVAQAYGITPRISPTYFYSFNRQPSYFQDPTITQALFGVADSACFGASHSFELAFLFNVFDIATRQSLTSDELALRQTMRNAWASFVVTGAPQLPSGSWPLFSTSTQFVNLDLTLSVDQNFRATYCDFWKSVIFGIPTTAPTPPPATTTTTSSDAATSSTSTTDSSTTDSDSATTTTVTTTTTATTSTAATTTSTATTATTATTSTTSATVATTGISATTSTSSPSQTSGASLIHVCVATVFLSFLVLLI